MITIVIPTYKECDNLRRLLPLINYELCNDYKVIIVDDNSNDGTKELLNGMSYPIEMIIRPKKLGYASAIREGISAALKNKSDIIVTMDADLSHNPIYLRQMIDNINGYDVVIGSRYNKGGVKDTRLLRLFISRIGNYVAEKFCSYNVKDSTSGFRVYKSSVFDAIDLHKTKMVDGYAFLILITDMVIKSKLKVKEFPIVFEDRYDGKSKISRRIILEALVLVILLALQRDK